MNSRTKRMAGFSLVEVTITIALTTFALVAMIGLLPVGLHQTRAAIDETRAAQLCRMIFATLESEPFTAANCFAPPGSPSIDLSKSGSNGGSDSAVVFASYDVLHGAAIVRTDQPTPDAEYQIELRFRPVPRNASDPGGEVRGSLVGFKVSRLKPGHAVMIEGAHYVSRVAYGPQLDISAGSNASR